MPLKWIDFGFCCDTLYLRCCLPKVDCEDWDQGVDSDLFQYLFIQLSSVFIYLFVTDRLLSVAEIVRRLLSNILIRNLFYYFT